MPPTSSAPRSGRVPQPRALPSSPGASRPGPQNSSLYNCSSGDKAERPQKCFVGGMTLQRNGGFQPRPSQSRVSDQGHQLSHSLDQRPVGSPRDGKSWGRAFGGHTGPRGESTGRNLPPARGKETQIRQNGHSSGWEGVVISTADNVRLKKKANTENTHIQKSNDKTPQVSMWPPVCGFPRRHPTPGSCPLLSSLDTLTASSLGMPCSLPQLLSPLTTAFPEPVTLPSPKRLPYFPPRT